MASLLNKYLGDLTDKQFYNVLLKFDIDQRLNINNYDALREKVINISTQEKVLIDRGKQYLFILLFVRT